MKRDVECLQAALYHMIDAGDKVLVEITYSTAKKTFTGKVIRGNSVFIEHSNKTLHECIMGLNDQC